MGFQGGWGGSEHWVRGEGRKCRGKGGGGRNRLLKGHDMVVNYNAGSRSLNWEAAGTKNMQIVSAF